MKVSLFTKSLEELNTGALVIGCFEDSLDELKEYHNLTEGVIKHLIEGKDFSGKLNQTCLIRLKGNINRLLLLGLGKRNEFNINKARESSGKAAVFLKDNNIKNIAIKLFPDLEPYDAAFAITEGVKLSTYLFTDFKTQNLDEVKRIESFTLFSDKIKFNEIDRAIKDALIISESVCLARDLANNPGNIATPMMLVNKSKEVARRNKLKINVLEKKDLLRLGMGGILAVNRGSANPPALIKLEYDGGGKETICFIGKGITFDSGGISLKPSNKMEEMKFDMCGGAAVIGIMQAASKLKLKNKIIGLIPTTENLPGGNAYKPGDIIKIYNGKTVEIVNTDAEGRLILADALSYAEKYNPDVVVDFATLTGACVVALGGECSAVFSNDDILCNKIIKAGDKTDEKIWRMPMFDEYKEELKSSYADLKNCGSSNAGAITAAMFLKEFTKCKRWAHLDIAGTAWVTNGKNPLKPVGGTGVGVRLAVEMLRNWKE